MFQDNIWERAICNGQEIISFHPQLFSINVFYFQALQQVIRQCKKDGKTQFTQSNNAKKDWTYDIICNFKKYIICNINIYMFLHYKNEKNQKHPRLKLLRPIYVNLSWYVKNTLLCILWITIVMDLTIYPHYLNPPIEDTWNLGSMMTIDQIDVILNNKISISNLFHLNQHWHVLMLSWYHDN
jgi:hypothetical protein